MTAPLVARQEVGEIVLVRAQHVRDQAQARDFRASDRLGHQPDRHAHAVQHVADVVQHARGDLGAAGDVGGLHQLGARLRESIRHAVELPPEHADLVSAGGAELLAQAFAGADAHGVLRHAHERSRDHLREHRPHHDQQRHATAETRQRGEVGGLPAASAHHPGQVGPDQQGRCTEQVADDAVASHRVRARGIAPGGVGQRELGQHEALRVGNGADGMNGERDARPLRQLGHQGGIREASHHDGAPDGTSLVAGGDRGRSHQQRPEGSAENAGLLRGRVSVSDERVIGPRQLGDDLGGTRDLLAFDVEHLTPAQGSVALDDQQQVQAQVENGRGDEVCLLVGGVAIDHVAVGVIPGGIVLRHRRDELGVAHQCLGAAAQVGHRLAQFELNELGQHDLALHPPGRAGERGGDGQHEEQDLGAKRHFNLPDPGWRRSGCRPRRRNATSGLSPRLRSARYWPHRASRGVRAEPPQGSTRLAAPPRKRIVVRDPAPHPANTRFRARIRWRSPANAWRLLKLFGSAADDIGVSPEVPPCFT